LIQIVLLLGVLLNLGDQKDQSVIVVADTHFGLDKSDQGCDPMAFAGFLNWIKGIESGKKETLKLGYWDSTDSGEASVDINPPEKIIFLGDILELWDSSNETVISSTMGILKILFELKSEKTYILGNHDNDLAHLANYYPLGDSILDIRQEEDLWLRKGDELFYFLHGHQFDKKFSLSSWRAIPAIRKAALAFGNYSLVFLALLLADLTLLAFGFGGIESILLALLFFAMSFPFLFIKLARGAWNSFRTIKYNPEYALTHESVWKRCGAAGEKVNIVFGHTHAIDFWSYKMDKDSFTLWNLPSWVRDFSVREGTQLVEESIEREISHVFLYIAEDFIGFVGWDSERNGPYYIPTDVVDEKRARGNLSKFERRYGSYLINQHNIKQELERIGWSNDLIRKWRTGFTTGNL
jgi:metallophosphoesterase superfamily enzyme